MEATDGDTATGEAEAVVDGDASEEPNSTQSYRTQRRGGGGLMDIKTSQRNGPVIGIVPVTDEDELLMMTARGKVQRIAANEINIIGRNTQGVRIMKLDDEDALTAIVKVPKEAADEELAAEQANRPAPAPDIAPPPVDLDEESTGEAEDEVTDQ